MIKKIKSNKKLSLVLVSLLVILGFSTALASTRTIFAGEARLLFDINAWSNVLKFPFLVITYTASGYTVALILIGLLIKKLYQTATVTFSLLGMAAGLNIVIKHIVARPRPASLLSGVIQRQAESGYGFPSLHVTAATVMAITLCRMLPKSYRWEVATLWIVLVALSRIYLGVHAPLDVVGGFALGGVIALIPDVLTTFIDKPQVKKKT